MSKKKSFVDPKTLAVLLVDMQERFVCQLRKRDRNLIIPRQLEVIRLCAERDIPLVVLEYLVWLQEEYEYFQEPTIPELFAEAQKVRRCKVVSKGRDDGFLETSLKATLESLGASHLLLMGVNAGGCVLATAGSAVKLGFRVITAGDLIANDRRPSKYDKGDKSAPWYEKNGVFCQEYLSLLPVFGLDPSTGTQLTLPL